MDSFSTKRVSEHHVIKPEPEEADEADKRIKSEAQDPDDDKQAKDPNEVEFFQNRALQYVQDPTPAIYPARQNRALQFVQDPTPWP